MRVIAVTTKRQLREFVRVPQMLFGDHPCYVPPIWLDEAQAYTKKANPILRNSDFALFLALDDAGKKGFLAAYAERVAAAYPRQPDGRTLFPFRRIFIVAGR